MTQPKIEKPTDPLTQRPNDLIGQNIVCFAKDWNEDPTSCNHVLRELSKRNRVLWVNSISTRSPNLASKRDIGKIFRKLGSFFQGPRQEGERLWVYTPLVLPLHHKAWAVKFNRLWLRLTLAVLTRKLGMRGFQLWTFVPTSADYVGHLGEQMSVYYVTDNWKAFSSVDGAQIGDMVDRLSRKADVVFATSHSLVDSLRPHNPETHLATHGVEFEKFRAALDPKTKLPADIASLPGTVIGYYGLVEDWMDQDLIAYLAERHPEWSIALVGAIRTDVSKLEKLPNVHLLGRKPHAELPAYCKGFAVGLIPHKVNDLTRNMNPIKLREYVCAGLPVVSVALPEVAFYPDQCTVAPDYVAFEQGILNALATDSPEARRRRSDAMREETWERKVARLAEIVARTQATKQQSPQRRTKEEPQRT
jgi:hypothetical protein